jgi:hypothetical protein
MTLVVTGNIPKYIGFAIIAAGLAFNELTLSALLKAGEPLGPSGRAFILLMNLTSVALGARLAIKQTIDLRFIFMVLFLTALSVALLELSLLTIMHSGYLRSSSIVLPITRPLYWQQGAMVQYMPDCARHHSALGYTLKPGECTFSNLEFSNRFKINSAGFRDDEASLEAPEIIILGDSQAMGWGVDQEETFAHLLEKKTGRRVLNAAISSYGSVRALMALKTINRRHLKYIVLQYSDNDYMENYMFAKGGNNIAVMSDDDYNCLVRSHAREIAYYPGRLTYSSLKQAIPALHWFDRLRPQADCLKKWEHMQRPEDGDPSPRVAAQLFGNAVIAAGVDLSGVQLIFLEVSAFMRNTSIIDQIKHSDPLKLATLITLDVSNFLSIGDFYPLDGHLKASGHAKIASALHRIVGGP